MQNILNFPATSFIDRLIPKVKFVKASDTPTAVRDLLTREFEQVRLLYVLRADTLNVAQGEEVTEIDVFYFRAKEDSYSANPFCGLDDLIPRHTLYIINHGDKTDVLMQHKRRIVAGGTAKWKREATHLQREVSLPDVGLRIEGMNMDAVYVNLLAQLAGKEFDSIEDYQQKTAEAERRAKLVKQIASLEAKARRETQQRKKFELVKQLNDLKKTL